MAFKDMTVGELKAQLEPWPDYRSICMTSRIQHGTKITGINFVGEDKHGNLVVTLDDSLLKSNAEAHGRGSRTEQPLVGNSGGQ